MLAIWLDVWKMRGEGNGNPLQYSCLENPMDGGAWSAVVHGVAKSQTQLSDFTFTFHFHALEKEMSTHSSILAWRIPGMREPGGLPSTGSHRVRHDWSYLAAAAAWKMSKKISLSEDRSLYLGIKVTLVCMFTSAWNIEVLKWWMDFEFNRIGNKEQTPFKKAITRA